MKTKLPEAKFFVFNPNIRDFKYRFNYDSNSRQIFELIKDDCKSFR